MQTTTTSVVVFALLLSASGVRAQTYWPQGSEWATLSPAEAGMDPQRLQESLEYALAQNSLGVVVLRQGKIVAEAYAPNWGRDKRHEIFSAAKSMLSILAGMALEDGKFKSLDQGAADFVPGWKGTGKEKITLRHLLSMTSGLRARGLAARNVSGNQFAINSATPLDHPPGTYWEYNTPAYHLTFHLIALATGEKFEAYAQRKLVGPLGMENLSWVMNQGQGDTRPVSNYYSAECTTRDMARFGLLVERQGEWNSKQLVSAAYVKQATTPSQELNPSYGLLFWANSRPGGSAQIAGRAASSEGTRRASLRFPGSPSDTIAALGAGSQNIMVVPSLELVVARQGEAPQEAEMAAKFLRQVVDSITKPRTAAN